MSTSVIHKPLTDSETDKAIAEAQNTPCGIEGCNGWQHEDGVAPSAWTHEVVKEGFDRKNVTASVWIAEDGKANGYIDYEANGDMTAAEFRAEADTYEAFPAWLRSMADRIDTLNAQAWIAANPKWKTVPVADVMRAMDPSAFGAIFTELRRVGAIPA